MLGLLVVGGGIGFTGFMATRPDSVGEFVAAVQSDSPLVAVSLVVVAFGVALSAYGFRD
jgi:hypothetical protein